jgi:hypothetical protein
VCFEETWLAGAGFYHASIRGEIAFENRERPLRVDWIRNRSDHIVIVDFGAFEVLAERLAGHSDAIEMQRILDPAHQAGQASGIEEIFHQVGVA